MLRNLPAGGAERMTGPQPLEDLLEAAAMFRERKSEEWRREKERDDSFLFLVSCVSLPNCSNLALLELCIYR